LDSLVRIEAFQWVTRDFRDYNFFRAFPLAVEARERTPSVEAMRQGMIVHAANLAMFLIFVNRLLLNRKLQPPLIALDVGNSGSLNFWGGARPTPGVMAGLVPAIHAFRRSGRQKGSCEIKKLWF